MNKHYNPYKSRQAFKHAWDSHKLYAETHRKEATAHTRAYKKADPDRYRYQQYRGYAHKYIGIANLKDLAQAMGWIRQVEKKASL